MTLVRRDGILFDRSVPLHHNARIMAEERRRGPITQPTDAFTRIEGEIVTGLGPVQLIRSSWDQPIDRSGTGESHHVQLSLMPLSGRAEGCFPEHWGSHRFEEIGDMFFLPAGETVRIRSNCQQQHAIACLFQPEAVATWLDEELHWTDGRLQAALDIGNGHIRRLLFRMGEEIRSPGFGGDALVELMAAQVAVELARHFRAMDGDQATGGLSPWRLRLIDERLADQSGIPSLGELAALCNISVRHLTRAFRVSRGRSIGSHIAEYRVDEAKSLLADGRSVKEVAFALGFTAPSNFAAAFRRATGEPPRDYRQRARRRSSGSAQQVAGTVNLSA